MIFSWKASLKANYKSATELLITHLFAVKNMTKSSSKSNKYLTTTWTKFFTNRTWKGGVGDQKAATEKKNFPLFPHYRIFSSNFKLSLRSSDVSQWKKSACRAWRCCWYAIDCFLAILITHHYFAKKEFPHTLTEWSMTN